MHLKSFYEPDLTKYFGNVFTSHASLDSNPPSSEVRETSFRKQKLSGSLLGTKGPMNESWHVRNKGVFEDEPLWGPSTCVIKVRTCAMHLL